MKCKYCDSELSGTKAIPSRDENRPAGTLPTLELKALGLYHSERMTIGMIKTTFGVINTNTGIAELAVQPIVIEERFMPRQLHRLPGLPYNAYPIVNGVGAFIVCDVAPTTFAFALKYRDPADIETVALAYRLPATVIKDAITSPLAPIISSTFLGERPSTLGNWVLEGAVTMGGAASIVVTVVANFGILYGAPK